jgi:hypothetical protein
MAVALYFDHHIPKAITRGLRLRDVECLTAFEDNAAESSDPDLLDRAMALGRVLVTSDRDFLIEAERRQVMGLEFAGIIYAHPLRVSVRTCIDDLETIAKVGQPQDFENLVQFLPL